MTSSTVKKFLILTFFLANLIPSASFSQTFDTPIVFVSRNHEANGNIFFPDAGLLPGMGAFSRFKVTGGKLMARDASGIVSTLIDSSISFGNIRIIDIQQPCVYWNGQKIVFAGIEHRDSSWRIYEINKNGTRIKKITFTDRIINLSQFGAAAKKFVKYDDIDPVYL
nr:hypothetical protein [Bacteroidota bacterium]